MLLLTCLDCYLLAGYTAYLGSAYLLDLLMFGCMILADYGITALTYKVLRLSLLLQGKLRSATSGRFMQNWITVTVLSRIPAKNNLRFCQWMRMVVSWLAVMRASRSCEYTIASTLLSWRGISSPTLQPSGASSARIQGGGVGGRKEVTMCIERGHGAPNTCHIIHLCFVASVLHLPQCIDNWFAALLCCLMPCAMLCQ